MTTAERIEFFDDLHDNIVSVQIGVALSKQVAAKLRAAEELASASANALSEPKVRLKAAMDILSDKFVAYERAGKGEG